MTKNIRPIRIDGNIAYVTLTQGFEAVVDAADADLVQGKNWHVKAVRRQDGSLRACYAVHNEPIGGGRYRTLKMHRLVANTPCGMETDHINGNGLDNRQLNLRNVTPQQNTWNQRRRTSNASGFKGVSWCKRRAKWQASIRAGKEQRFLGYSQNKEDAHAAYCKASSDLHGEFGRVA